MRWLDRAIKAGAKQGVESFIASPECTLMIDTAIKNILSEPEYAWFWFVKHMQRRMMEVDKTMTGKAAWQIAANAYRGFLHDEKIQFGDPRYAWDEDGARDIIQSYEIDHWESAP